MASRSHLLVALVVIAPALARAQVPEQPAPDPWSPSPSPPSPEPSPSPPSPESPPTEATTPPAPTQAPTPAQTTPEVPAPPVTPAPAPSPPRAAPAKDEEPRPYSVAFEVGYGWTADDQHAFGNGFGRVLVFAYKAFEMRLLEDYDLEDRAMVAAAYRDRGRMGMSSVGYRMNANVGPIAIRPLLGIAWIRRASLVRTDEFSTVETLSQHGIALQAGVGVQLMLGRISIGADLRVYPTKWGDVGAGTFLDEPVERAEVDEMGAVRFVRVDENPGGMPRTTNAWIAVHW